MIELKFINSIGAEGALLGMRNAYDSRDKSDSYTVNIDSDNGTYSLFMIGDKDMELCKKLIAAGSSHRKFLRHMFVQFDVKAPLYWLKELDTYRVGVERNSGSTMHTIHKKAFDIHDFSHDKLSFDDGASTALAFTISELNHLRSEYLRTKDKKYWYMMVQLLPSSYNQFRTYTFSYEALLGMYHDRCNHRLDEWRDFCEWIKNLRYMREFISVFKAQ